MTLEHFNGCVVEKANNFHSYFHAVKPSSFLLCVDVFFHLCLCYAVVAVVVVVVVVVTVTSSCFTFVSSRKKLIELSFS